MTWITVVCILLNITAIALTVYLFIRYRRRLIDIDGYRGVFSAEDAHLIVPDDEKKED